MSPNATPPATVPAPAASGNGQAAIRDLVAAIRNRILSGLFLVLPTILTFVILGYLYSILRAWVLDPTARLVGKLAGPQLNEALPSWWVNLVSPLIAILLILTLLYFLGYFVRSRIFAALDWILLRVPVVTTVYKGVRNVFSSFESDSPIKGLKRVVLVTFPSPGSKALGFVTKTLTDRQSGRNILAVSVLTGVLPPAGFTLFVPEEEAVEVDWTVEETLQVILTGGLNAPTMIPYFGGPPPKASEARV